ncbi:MAG: hypothetical protein B7733_05230 [Myxococcales bacterium FL481]|nr:MAG: hypothetical protein B7733_05230 [Myxococcales bacterium FL481]
MSRTLPDRPPAADELRQLADNPLALELRDDLEVFVPQLPSPAFVTLARKLRHEQRLELLLPHATAEQLTSVADLDSWEGDRLIIPKARAWLAEIARCYQLAERSEGELARLIGEMDSELWTLALMHATTVIELDPNDNMSRHNALDGLAELRPYETPDGLYVLGAPDDEFGRVGLALIDAIYRDDLGCGGAIVAAIKWSLAAELEEQLLQWRRGRLADLGFPEWEAAMTLFRPLAIEAALAAESAKRPPGVPIGRASEAGLRRVSRTLGHDLLQRAMAALDDSEHGERSREFLLVANELIVAQRLEPGDESHQERSVLQASATIGLALERLLAAAQPDDVDAFLADRIRAVGLRSLFRVGYDALALLRKTALALHRKGGVSASEVGSLLDRPWGPALRSLSAWLPELALTSTKGTRPIKSRADVVRATSLLAAAGALASLCFHADAFAVDPLWISRVDEPERLTLGDLIRTALVHESLPGSAGSLAPLTPTDVAWAREHLLERGRLQPAIAQRFHERCQAIGAAQAGEALAEVLLPRLEVELSAVEYVDGTPDLTRLGGLMTVQQVSVWLQTSHGGATPDEHMN